MMRVLLVSNESEIVGGGEISLLLLVGGLCEHPDIEPVLAVPDYGAVARRGETLGVQVVTLPLPRLRHRLWHLPSARRRAAAVIEGAGPDLVHCNGSRAMLIAGGAARRLHLPVVWHVRVEGGDILDRRLGRAGTVIITPSRAVADRFPSDRVRVIPNPVEVPVRRRDDPAIESLRQELAGGREYLLLTAGVLTPRKNVPRTLHALAGLTGLDFTFIVAGRDDPGRPGSDQAVLEAIRETGLADRVSMLGFREDIPDLMLASDLLIHAPDSEGFGRVYIEAMAAGLPVVCTPVGGLAELHAETGYGWLAADMSSAALGETIATALAESGERERLHREGPQIAAREYSVSAHAGRVAAVYQALERGLSDPEISVD